MNEKKKLADYISESPPYNLAIVGCGKACRFFLDLLKNGSLVDLGIQVVGVCDINPEAEGINLAKKMGIFTTKDYKKLLEIKNLDGVIELTDNQDVLVEAMHLRPKGVRRLEYNVSRLLRELLMMNLRFSVAKQQVAQQEMALEFLINQANERIVVLTPDFSIIDANDAYLRAVGRTKEEVIGAHCYKITHGLSAPCSSSHLDLGCPLIDTLRTGQSAQIIHEHPSPDAEPTYCDMVTYPLKDQGGEIVQVIEIWRDITDKLASRLENRFNEMKADLNKIIQEDRMISLGRLVASSVHEINNPIQGLMTLSSLMEATLKEGDLSPSDVEDFRKHLSLMSRELERCGNIATGLLSFSRQSSVEYINVDLNDILGQVISLTRHKMEIQNIRLIVKLAPEPLIINGDINQLQQCFLNLIFNSMEAMPEGGTLSISSAADDIQRRASILFRDSGIGIQEEHLDHIFDPFFTTKEEGQGTGMGLSIVYGVIKNHGGFIEAKSKHGEGTDFTLQFPLI
jgi:two-component system NtrC family sensor kinase